MHEEKVDTRAYRCLHGSARGYRRPRLRLLACHSARGRVRRMLKSIMLVAALLLCTIASAASDREVCDNSQAPNVEVISACARLIEANPRDAIAYFNRGSAFHNQSRSHDRSADRIVVDAKLARRAIEDFTQAIRLQVPEWRFRAAYFDRGTSYQDIGEYDNAIADFTDLIKLDPNNAGGYGMRGRLYLHKKDYANARADFLKAIDLLEKQKDQANKTEEARARELSPNFGDGRIRRQRFELAI